MDRMNYWDIATQKQEPVDENSTIEIAIRRFANVASPKNQAAVLDSIYRRMNADGQFLVSSNDVEIMDYLVAAKEYDKISVIDAYTSAEEFFMGIDEEDESYATGVKIRDLLSFVAKAKDASACIDINYKNRFILSRDMAAAILKQGTECGASQREEQGQSSRTKQKPLSSGEITTALISGVRYCFICSRDYSNFCNLYHGNGKVYSVNLYDRRCRIKLCKIFPAFREFLENDCISGKIGTWECGYIGGGCGLLVHEEVVAAYRERTGLTERLDWSPDDAIMTIGELSKEKVCFEPMRISDKTLKTIGAYKKERDGILTGWVYLGDDENERYVLGEPKNENILVLGVNPSMAKPENLDPTTRNVKRIIEEKYGKDFGWIMMNLHPQRATNPKDMKENAVWSENNLKVVKAVTDQFEIYAIWCAWGNMIDMPGKNFLYTSLDRIYKIAGASVKWYHYGDFTNAGNPRHPLRMSIDHDFFPFSLPDYLSQKTV